MLRRIYAVELLCIIILLAVFPVVCSAQEVVIEGYVTDSLSHAPLYPATVLDQASGMASFTDSSGYYKIRAYNGDEIVLSYVGYLTVKYVVPQHLTNIIHNVQMISKRERLNEITVRSMTPYQTDSMERAGSFKHYLEQPKVNVIYKRAHSVHDVPDRNYNDAFGIELNPFSLFSKKGRNKKSFDKKYPEMEREAFINSRYTPDLVHKLTGLTGDSLSLFLYRFRPGYQFTRAAADLEFWSWIKIRYQAWIKPK
jgi:hypothetical protein